MKAVEVTGYGEPSVMDLVGTDRPDPGPGEVGIAVERAGVNFADIEQRRGGYPDGPRPPFVPGIEVAGRIAEAGTETDRRPGEQVAAVLEGGGYAEYATAPAAALFDVPSGMDIGDAAALPVGFLTAHNALFEWGGLDPGERVLIHAAAGGVGTAAVQLAVDAGATVIGTASTPEKRSLVRDLGAEHALDYTSGEVTAGVEAATTGEGVDLVLDGVGGEAFYAGLDVLAPGGRIVVYGLASGDVPTVSTPRLLFSNLSVIGYHLGDALSHAPQRVRRGMERLGDRLQGADIGVVNGGEYPLGGAPEAHAALENRETAGKLFLVP